ncbi:MAG TPA: hypothetical protein DCE41_19430 [Cytophagales bacterium]|nr:hypothetical protein [Cytophagales bacterium]HAA24120.1 hypothetical protein [Cytophagales bacterium]HAP58736.1 hypothetical protein [Cytophagales bacterium]
MIQQDLFSLKKATVWVAAGAMVGYGVNGDINIDRTATAPNTDLISISVQNTHPRLMPVVPLRLGTRIKLKKNALDFGFFSYFLGNENYHVGMSTAFIFSTLK